MPSWVVGETMTHAMPWNVRGVDGDVREAAFEAARAAGMSVGQWLDHVIRDNARDFGVDVDEPRARRNPRRDDGRRAARRERDADPFDQLAERLERIGRRERATAPLPAERAEVRPEKIAKVIETAVDALERSARATEEKTANALQKVTQWIERTEAERAQEARAPARPAPDAALLRPLEELGRKLQHIEERLTQAQAQQSPPRVERALAELEGKLTTIQRSLGEADKRQPAMPRELERTLQGLEQRMLQLAKTIEQKAGEPKAEAGTAESVERIESKLATLLDTLRQQAEAPVAAPAAAAPAPLPVQAGDARRSLIERDLRGVIGEIAERQRHLDQSLDAGEAIDPSAIETLRDDLAQVARRMDALADGLRSADLASFRKDLSRLDQSVEGLAERAAHMAASAVRDDLRVLSDQVQGLAPRHLVASIDHAVRDLADRIDDAKREEHSRFNLDAIADLLYDVKAAVDDMREPAPLQDMAETLRGMAGRMDEAERFDVGALSRLQDETSEIKDLIRRSLERQALDPLASRIDAIGQRLDSLTTMPARDMTEELSRVRHDLMSAMPSDTLQRIEERINTLASRLDDDVATGDGRSLDEISARLDMLTQRLERTHAPDAGLIGSLGERIERLQRSLETRQTQQGGQEFESLIRDLGQKLQAAPAHGGTEAVLARLQGEMERIALKLERGDVQVSSLASLERSIADLFKLVDELKGSAATTAERAARDALQQAIRHMEARLERSGDADVLDAVQREFGELKSAQKRAEDRTSETLSAVHQTLETLVGRLGQLERQATAGPRLPRPPESAEPAAPSPAPKAKREEMAAPAKPAAARDQTRSPISAAIAAARNAISAGGQTGNDRNADLAVQVEPRREPAEPAKPAAPDLPLEPGSGRPSPQRLGAADPVDPKEFIARTRRAQQAAAQQTAEAIAQRNGTDGKGEPKAPTRSLARSPKHVALLGLAVVAMGGVALTVANTMRNRAPVATPAPGAIERPAPKDEATPAVTPRLEQRSDVAPALPPRAEATQPQRAAEAVAADPVHVGALDRQPTGSIAPRRPIADTEPLARFEGLTAPERLRTAALSGDPAAQYEIAARYSEGRGGTRNQQVAREWFQRAAEAGHVPSQYRLAGLFREGRGIEKNAKLALDWFQRAAERGHVRAMHNLAVMLAEGASGSPDYATASTWFQRAAEFGVRDSQFNLAILTARGLGTSQDLVASYRWFDAAAKQGDEDSGKKRDEVGSRLSPDKLAEAKAAAASWRAKTPDPLVNDVAVPAGGWDAVPKQMPKPKTLPPPARS